MSVTVKILERKKKVNVTKQGYRECQDNYYTAVILLPAHPASFAHHFVSGMQSFYFDESEDAIVLQTVYNV